MPERTTVLVTVPPDASAGARERNALISQGFHVGPMLEEGDGFAGRYSFEAIFPDPTKAREYEDRLRGKGFAVTRRLTADAVRSWIGQRGEVRFANPGGGSVVLVGTIEELDAEHVRVAPRASSGGLDLGPSTFGSATAGDVRIADIIDIEPATR